MADVSSRTFDWEYLAHRSVLGGSRTDRPGLKLTRLKLCQETTERQAELDRPKPLN